MEQVENNTSSEILRFQIERKIISLAKRFLTILEDNKEYCLEMERTLKELGVPHFDQTNLKHLKNRKIIFDESGDCYRELQFLVEKLNLK